MSFNSYFGELGGLYLTSINVRSRLEDTHTDIQFEGVVTDPMVLNLLHDTMYHRGNLSKSLTSLRIVDQEFHCLYCTTPNPITNVSCAKCGAPRGFIIG